MIFVRKMKIMLFKSQLSVFFDSLAFIQIILNIDTCPVWNCSNQTKNQSPSHLAGWSPFQ